MNILTVKTTSIKPYSSDCFKFKMYITINEIDGFYTALLKDNTEASQTEAINRLKAILNKSIQDNNEIQIIATNKAYYLEALQGLSIDELKQQYILGRANCMNEALTDSEQLMYTGILQAALQLLKN